MKKREGFSFRDVLIILVFNLAIILAFTAVDYLTHHLNWNLWSVPEYYFKDKIIFGTFWGIVAYFVLRKWKVSLAVKSFVYSAIIAVLLQIRYALTGYALSFVILFLFIHFALLWLVSYLAFKLFRKQLFS